MVTRAVWRFAAVIFLCGAAVHADEPPRVDRYGDDLPPGAVARLGSVRFQHSHWLNALAYSADGKMLAASGCDDEPGVTLWEIPSGRLLRRLPLGGCSTSELLFSPDGKYLVGTYARAGFCVCDTTTGKQTVSKSTTVGPDFYHAAFSPDSKHLAIAVKDIVRLYDPSGVN